MAKFSAEVPKGDGWGVEEAVMQAVREIQEKHSKSPMIPIMGVIDIKEVKIDPETGNVIPVVRIRRMEALTTIDQIRTAQRMILERWAERHGEGATLPFEDDEILKRAFGADTVGNLLQDDEEQKIDAELDEQHRVLRHLKAVHDWSGDVTTDNPDLITDALRWHDEEHAADPADRAEGTGFPDHGVDETPWRRLDVAELLGTSEDHPEGDEIPQFTGPVTPGKDYAADFQDTASPDDLDDDAIAAEIDAAVAEEEGEED